MSAHRPRVFYGWWVVATAALGLFLGPVPIVVFSFGIFLRSLAQEFHSGRAAISLAFTLHNLVSALSVPVAGRLVDRRLIGRFGWRSACGIVGAAILLISVPVVGLFLKERPEEMGLLPDGVAQIDTAASGELRDQGVSWHEAWHTQTFWLLLCAFVLVSASVQGCFIHMASMLSDRGSTAQAAALGSSLLGSGPLLGRVGSGYLLDRFFAPRVAALIFSGSAVGIGLLWATNSRGLAFLAAFLIGMGLGAEVDIIAYLTSRYFGLRSFGQIYGFTLASFGLAGGLGVYLMGAGFDARGSYALPLASFFPAAVTGEILMTRLGPYRYGIREPYAVGPTQPVQTRA